MLFGFLKIQIILKMKSNKKMYSLFTLFFIVNILFLFFTQSAFFLDHFSFKLTTHSIKSHRYASFAFYYFYFFKICLKHRFGRICVRIWLNSVTTNVSIICKEYNNKKIESFLTVILTFYFWRLMMSSYNLSLSSRR